MESLSANETERFESFCGGPFWALADGNGTEPILSRCFLRSVCVGVPVGFLFASLPFLLCGFKGGARAPLALAALNISRIVVSVSLVLVWLVVLTHTLAVGADADGVPHPPLYFLYPVAFAAAFASIGLSQWGCVRRGVVTSGVLFLSWLLFLVFGVPETYFWLVRDHHKEDILRFVCWQIHAILVVIGFLLSCFADRTPAQQLYDPLKAQPTPTTDTAPPCPETGSSFLNQLTFWWFNPLAIKGYRVPLRGSDLWALNTRDACALLVSKWDAVWEPAMDDYWRRKALMDDARQAVHCRSGDDAVRISSKQADATTNGKGADGKEKAEETPKPPAPSIILSLFKCSWGLFVPGALLKLIYDLMQFINPLILGLVIAFVEDRGMAGWRGYVYAAAMFFVVQIGSLILHQYFHRVFTMGMHWRGIMVSAVFTKALRLSNAARKETTVGEVVNLMSVDAQRFQDVATYICMMWSSPMQIVLSLYFLWQILGPSVLAGLGVMILLMPLNFCLMSLMRKWSIEQMKHKDDRIKLMNEILSGIKVLKLYAWELSFEKAILEIREKELAVLRKTALLNAFTSFTWMCAPFLVAAGTFGTYVLTDPENHILTPKRAFVSLSLLNILRFPMTMLPGIISAMVQLMVSNRRLKLYLTAEELDERQVERLGRDEEWKAKTGGDRLSGPRSAASTPRDPNDALLVRNGVFTWDRAALTRHPDTAKPTLSNLNFSVGRGDLVAVVGTVGAGKSSLISAILGEMEKIEGYVGVRGRVAYVPQQAWIQNMTLQDNVLFGRPLDEARYTAVLEACALTADLDVLSHGDQTEIGEKGINLSGGQKQRVSLARAVYADADVVLLDDPLSAVDSHVGKHIFNKVIGSEGLLSGKTRLLVTHGLGYLKHADSIVVLKEGRISERGTYAELLAGGGAFAEFLETHLVAEVAAKGDDGDDGVTDETEEILCDLEKCKPGARHRLESQMSAISSTDTPTHEHAASETRSKSYSKSQSPPSQTQSPTRSDSDTMQSTPVKRRTPDSKRGSAKKEEEMKLLDNGKPVTIKQEGKNSEKMIQDESMETGRVQAKVYLLYIAAIGYLTSVMFAFLYFLSSGFSVGANIWLADWSDDTSRFLRNETAKFSVETRLGVYVSLGLSQGICVFVASVLMLWGMVKAASILHAGLLRNLFRSPSAFFDVTPLGRIINRCGKDVETVDNMLPGTTRMWLMCVVGVTSTLTVISASTPIFLTIILPLAIIYYAVLDVDDLDKPLPQTVSQLSACVADVLSILGVLFFSTFAIASVVGGSFAFALVLLAVFYLTVLRFYVSTSRQLKRLESVTRSPIYSHFGETLTGASSIRAYGAQDAFIASAMSRLDTNFAAYYPNIASNRWLAVRLEFVGNCVVFFAALFAVIGRNYDWAVTAGLAGLSISYALQITQALNWAVRMTSDLETNIVAVERIKEYSETPTEAAWESASGTSPPSEWPAAGKVSVESYATRYRPGLDLVLHDLSFSVEPGEKVGIVGRTGAGKSSLTLALFRLIEAAGGRIMIDGLDIARMGLHDLRSKLTIIPQDPVLFSGSLRMNLDPFERHTDVAVWAALEEAHLATFVRHQPDGLAFAVTEGGENMSLGQRQLLCLSRALLRRTRVLVLDEATAAVDLETDALIQATIRDKFSHATILTIAHRLNTIMDYDRVLVLDKGNLVEFAAPNVLLADKNSIFFGMAKDAGLVQ